MRYLSVCSGIEAATVAWHPLGWEAAAFAEIEAFPAAVLAHHYPAVPNYGDMTKHKEWDLGAIDLLVGGTPCQSFSVAGLRKGLDDPRGNLMLTYLAIADQRRPRWLVWENVPGVLSSNGGKDFGTFLGALAELGYGFAYRVLDAQFFGVAQRRRRVFVVGYLGDWRPAAAVLFEFEGLRRDTAPSREAGQKVAGTFTARVNSGGWGSDVDLAASEYMQPYQVANCLTQRMHKGMNSDCNEGQTPVLAPIALAENTIGRQPHNGGNGDGFTDGGPMYTLNATGVLGVAQPIAYALDSLASNSMKSANPASGCNEVYVSKALDTSRGLDPSCNQGGMAVAHPVAPTLTASNDPSRSPQSTEITNQVAAVHAASMAVRRLTPVECERLQGFPDEYTNIPWRKQPTAPDGPRYKALGNSMAVPVMHWIGRRISVYEDVMGKT